MSTSDREKRGYLDENPEEQIAKALPDMYEFSRKATTIESSLYFWAAVFHPTHRHQWSGKDPSANLVREILGTRKTEPRYLNNDAFDEILYTNDVNLIRETRRQAKKEGEEYKIVALENTLPQLSDLPSANVIMIKQLIREILSVCSYSEKRLFAFILVENDISDIIELFENKEELGDFNAILEELYTRMREEEEKRPAHEQMMRITKRVGKRAFVTQVAESNKRRYNNIVKSFREKMYPLFFPSPSEESTDESI